jgi:hypothetical protein
LASRRERSAVFEWKLARDQGIQDDTQCPGVRLAAVVEIAHDDFGRGVGF